MAPEHLMTGKWKRYRGEPGCNGERTERFGEEANHLEQIIALAKSIGSG